MQGRAVEIDRAVRARAGLWTALALALLAAAPASATTPGPQDTPAEETLASAPVVGSGLPLAIAGGERIVLTEAPGGTFQVREVQPLTGPPEGNPAPKGATEEHMYPAPNATFNAPPGTLVFSLWDDPTDGARLKLENGLTRPVIYSAVIVLRQTGGSVATTICSVAPGHTGFETWPNDLAAIRITGVYNAPGDKVCGYPERGELSAPPSSAPSPSAP